MFNRYIDNFDFKSRFRILKGGKISLVVSALLGSAIIVSAAPTGGVVTSGSATISQNGTTTNIDQTTNKSIINWQNFNVGANETVNFNMPSSSSTSLNRIIGNEASAIYGVINSNGQVFLVNQNGVYFSKTSQVNTAGFVASTKDIKDENFLKGNYVFEGNSNASIINLGTITTPNAYTALLAKKVENEGVIKATLGQIHLASGDKFTLDVNGNSLLKLTIDKGIIDGLVSNKGAVIADGGQIYMTTSALGEVLNGLVNNTGIIQANSIEEKDGKVILFAHGGTGEFGGTIEAKGGFVETSGKKVELKDDIKIKAKKWLIDPYDVEIVSDSVAPTIIDTYTTSQETTYVPRDNSTKIRASTLMTALNAGTDVTVTTSGSGTQNGDIFVNSAITWNSGSGLTLTADRNIYINSTIDASQDNGGYLVLNYGQASFSGSTSEYYVNAPISLQSGVNFSTQKGTDSNNYKEYIVINGADNAAKVTALQNVNNDKTKNYALS